jgi:hypothetical protein
MRALGYDTERLVGKDGKNYLVVLGYRISSGVLAGKICDLAIQDVTAVPYVAPAAIQIRPHLVPMTQAKSLALQNGRIGAEWQYWSRTFASPLTPPILAARIATVFSEVQEAHLHV